MLISEINEQYLNKSVSILHMVSCVSIYIVTAINKKRMAEEKKLSQGLEKYTVLRRDHVHRKEEVCTVWRRILKENIFVVCKITLPWIWMICFSWQYFTVSKGRQRHLKRRIICWSFSFLEDQRADRENCLTESRV